MKNEELLVLVGDGEFAEIAYEYFTFDSPFKVVAFAVEKEYIKKETLFDLPIIPFEEIEQRYPPDQYKVFVAINSTQLNRPRTRLFNLVKNKGYKVVSYISSKAFVWRNVSIGENTFIFENNVLQHYVVVGNNVIIWSGNHIGHRSVIKDNTFISSHVVIAGRSEIGESCFLGVNSTFNGNIKIGKDCFISSGAVVNKDTREGLIYSGNPAKSNKITSYRYYGIEAE
ncbi:acetyltransferase [Solibacillus sp. FSL W8-0474]|uniref:acetyltransferase n=1 Tax=Solibacillus sp. FSL W8-0474 TaxID=2975336 RepID=UPI0030F51106